ncbi:MAG: DUF3108 domain-containing protein [Trueperaceae bacterium]|nr:DUF3108 domain-containing protein [Trueperaceae bacterium]
MSVEVCTYRVSLRGKTIGGQTLQTYQDAREVRLGARLELWGSWGEQTIVQQSELAYPSLLSRRFSEETHDRGGKRLFEVSFDAEAGLVRASRGPKDRAEIPYVRDYQDPLGLLYRLRQLAGPVTKAATGAASDTTSDIRIPMLGKDVVVERRGAASAETMLGEVSAELFVLYPGVSYVYVGVQPPHPIVRMVQRFDHQFLDVLLVRTEQEEGGLEPTRTRRRQSTRRRRAKRRRAR